MSSTVNRTHTSLRSLLGILAGPPTVGAVAGIVVATPMGLVGHDLVSAVMAGVTYGSIIGAILGWPVGILLGVVAHRLLKHRKWTRAAHYLLGGAVCGLIPTPLALALGWGMNEGRLDLAAWAFFGSIYLLAAAFSGLVFWLIRRPDKDLKEEGPAHD